MSKFTTHLVIDQAADGCIRIAGIRIDDTEARRIADRLHGIIENRTETT